MTFESVSMAIQFCRTSKCKQVENGQVFPFLISRTWPERDRYLYNCALCKEGPDRPSRIRQGCHVIEFGEHNHDGKKTRWVMSPEAQHYLEINAHLSTKELMCHEATQAFGLTLERIHRFRRRRLATQGDLTDWVNTMIDSDDSIVRISREGDNWSILVSCHDMLDIAIALDDVMALDGNPKHMKLLGDDGTLLLFGQASCDNVASAVCLSLSVLLLCYFF